MGLPSKELHESETDMFVANKDLILWKQDERLDKLSLCYLKETNEIWREFPRCNNRNHHLEYIVILNYYLVTNLN